VVEAVEWGVGVLKTGKHAFKSSGARAAGAGLVGHQATFNMLACLHSGSSALGHAPSGNRGRAGFQVAAGRVVVCAIANH
jgi:hypothetical protein